SGAAVSQAREAVRQEEGKGNKVGLIKGKTIRPWPRQQIIDAAKHAKTILVPEFNHAGWLHKEVCATLYGHSKGTIYNGPRVFGGMTMPTEMILDWLAEIRNKTGSKNLFV
ncbi:MAG TPA: ferredoxin oxidoreductase, partial [Nitrospinaceae bacterium]|nr:ferredoxin oxidoreductase [Nitrospinaceae bacterium]